MNGLQRSHFSFYGPGDRAFAGVVQRIKNCLPDAEAVLTSVPPFATLAAGFCIA
jgi:hypothetical protein